MASPTVLPNSILLTECAAAVRTSTRMAKLVSTGTRNDGGWADLNNCYGSVGDLCGGGSRMINCHNNNGVYAFHTGGAGFLFADGSVKFIQQDVPLAVITGLFTATGGEAIPGNY